MSTYALAYNARVVAYSALALTVATILAFGIGFGVTISQDNPSATPQGETGNLTWTQSWNSHLIGTFPYAVNTLRTPGQNYYVIVAQPPNVTIVAGGGAQSWYIQLARATPAFGSIFQSAMSLWPTGFFDQSAFVLSPTPAANAVSLWGAQLDGGYYVFFQTADAQIYNVTIVKPIQFRIPIWG
jgi:hypothetical protein